MTAPLGAGIFFAVVGPSGSGKDTLINGARDALAADGRFHFARRVITRPADAGGEDHEAIDEAAFARLAADGGLLISWEAHGLCYGLCADLLAHLHAGRHVVANCSRAVIDALNKQVPRLTLISVTASQETLAARLKSRGRETEADIAARLRRRPTALPDALETFSVANDGTVDDGIKNFVGALTAAANRLRVRHLPIDAGGDDIAYLPRNSIIGGATAADKLEIVTPDGSSRPSVHLVQADWLLAPDEIGVSERAFKRLNVNPGHYVSVRRPPPQSSRDALRAKIRGEELGEADYERLLRDMVEGRYADSEIAAFLVSAIRSLTDDEIVALARVRARFSPALKWDEPIVADKHSMGGVPGSRITMIVVPIVAAHGLAIPKTSSRAITSAAGTADVMEVLARVDLNVDEVRRTVGSARACIAWNGLLNHSAVDDVMNTITRPLGLDSARWSVASIISKKLTAGSTHVIIDLPYGSRTKLRDKREAAELGALFEKVGRAVGLHVEAHPTSADAPIGHGIGPALEARDVLRVLEGHTKAPHDLRDKALFFASRILSWDPAVGTMERAFARAKQLLESGAALDAMQRIIETQGRRDDTIGPSPLTHTVRTQQSGTVDRIDGWRIAEIARQAGAPREKGAGIDLLRQVGDTVAHGDALFTIHAGGEAELETAAALTRDDNGFHVELLALPHATTTSIGS